MISEKVFANYVNPLSVCKCFIVLKMLIIIICKVYLPSTIRSFVQNFFKTFCEFRNKRKIYESKLYQMQIYNYKKVRFI